MNYKQFKKITSVLEKNYDKNYDETILKIWYHELKCYDVNQYKRIVLDAIKKYKFLPTLAEILAIKPLGDNLTKEIEFRQATPEEQKEMEELLKEFR